MVGGPVTLLAFYLLCCGAVGWVGKGRRLGFWPALFLAILLTPFLMVLFLYLFSKPSIPPAPER